MDSACTICKNSKAPHSCGLCQGLVCKRCLEKHPKDSFYYLPSIPEALNHKTYCAQCYSRSVVPVLMDYESTLARAKALFVFHKGQGEETRLYNRSEKSIRIEGCEDRSEVLLRLAFLAAKANFNTLLDVEIVPQKIQNGGYQTTRWTAQGIPTNLDGEKLHRKEHAAIHKTFLSSY